MLTSVDESPRLSETSLFPSASFGIIVLPMLHPDAGWPRAAPHALTSWQGESGISSFDLPQGTGMLSHCCRCSRMVLGRASVYAVWRLTHLHSCSLWWRFFPGVPGRGDPELCKRSDSRSRADVAGARNRRRWRKNLTGTGPGTRTRGEMGLLPTSSRISSTVRTSCLCLRRSGADPHSVSQAS